MALYDCMLLISGLLNAFVFTYGCMLMVTKSIYRKHELKLAACVGMINDRRVSLFAHITTKAIINMITSLAMVGIALFVIVTSEVCYKPFFAYDSNIAFANSLLLAVCIFNMVLMLLTETLSLRNIHEIPVYMVTSLVSIAIIVREEDAITGVICLFMFGSILSDELSNLRSISFDSTVKRCNKGVHVFRISMHILCNMMFPVIMFFVPAWFTKQNLFQMEKSSIIIFFFAATFFVFCSAWRLTCVLKQFLMKAKKVNTATDPKVQAEVWCPNNISAILVTMLNSKVTKLVPSRVCDKELLFKNSNKYVMIDGLSKVNDSIKNNTNQSPNIIYKPSGGKVHERSVQFETIDLNGTF